MNGLQQLINQLCPNGVEWKTLGEVAKVKRGDRITKKDLIPNGKYPVMSGGTCFFGRYSKYNRCANTITVAQYGSAGFVSFVTEDFWANDVCYSVFPLDIIVNKYLYYCLVDNQQVLYSLTTKAIPDCLPQNRLESLQIPLPPLAIQSRIVEILDHFTNLTANLTAELALRRKQFEHFREKLLSLDGVEGVEMKTLGEVCSDCYAGATPSTKKREYWENGTIPWMCSGEVNKKIIYSVEGRITELGYNNCSTKMVPINSVVIALAGQGKTRGLVAITRTELCTNQSLCAIVPKKDEIIGDYIYYYLDSQYQQLRIISSGDGTRGGLNLSMIRNYQIPVPPLAVQQSIVAKLDKITALIQNIENELALRQKQYEYYREKLLSFPSPSL